LSFGLRDPDILSRRGNVRFNTLPPGGSAGRNWREESIGSAPGQAWQR
jgi:hypothetical protein